MAPRNRIEYLFCQNPECSVHASALVGAMPADSPIQEGQPCPRCGRPIEKILIEGSPSVPAAGRVTVLPGEPYGGFMLQRNDDDSSKTWEGTAQSDPRHDGAHYVAEFQHDMLRIAHYDPARRATTLGKFDLEMMGCILDLKKHLGTIHGASFNPDLNTVNATAGRPNAPVHFPPAGLVSPSEATGDVAEWAKFLGQSRSDNKLLKQLRVWDRQWTEMVKVNAPLDSAEVDEMRQENRSQEEILKQLVPDRVQAAKTIQAAESRTVALRRARNAGTLTEEGVVGLEQAAQSAFNEGNGVGQRLEQVAAALRLADGRIPTKSTSRDPIDKPITVTTSPAATELNARFDRADSEIKDLRNANNNQLTWVTFFSGLRQQLKQRLDQLGKRLRDLDGLAASATEGMDQVRDQVSTSASAATTLNQFSQGKTGTETQELMNARKFVAAWLDEPGGSAKGSLSECLAFLTTRTTELGDQSLDAPPRWPDLIAILQQAMQRMETFRTELDAASAPAWANGYKEQLCVFGTLDRSTAHYVKEMVHTGRLNGKPIFRVPHDDEVTLLGRQELERMLPLLLDQGLTKVQRTAGDGPLPILKFIFVHESGAKHVGNFAGKMFVKLGIDWRNSSRNAASFHETLTSGKRLSKSRGWGTTQFTTFDEQEFLLEGPAGAVVKFNFDSGIPVTMDDGTQTPMPLLISSEEKNVFEGLLRYLRGFRQSVVKRECSFQPDSNAVSDRSYDCNNCAKLLKTGPASIQDGLRTFDDTQGDFERVIPEKGKRLPVYRLRKMDRLRELLSTGKYKLEDARSADEAVETDLDEFPCSWLTCVAFYSGGGRRPFDYLLEAIETMAK